jgi:hypothetical protein
MLIRAARSHLIGLAAGYGTSLIRELIPHELGGVFDLYAATRNTDIAQQVHDCLGRLLAQVVFAGAKMAMPPK